MLETVPETVGPVLPVGPGPELVPALVLVPGTEPGTVLELELEAEMERGNIYSALHP